MLSDDILCVHHHHRFTYAFTFHPVAFQPIIVHKCLLLKIQTEVTQILCYATRALPCCSSASRVREAELRAAMCRGDKPALHFLHIIAWCSNWRTQTQNRKLEVCGDIL